MLKWLLQYTQHHVAVALQEVRNDLRGSRNMNLMPGERSTKASLHVNVHIKLMLLWHAGYLLSSSICSGYCVCNRMKTFFFLNIVYSRVNTGYTVW